MVAACALALGLATGVPVLLPRSDVYEVAISCGYMLTMLALGAIWCALHETERRWRWLAAASVAYGLAVGARPSLLFGAIILLVPVAQAWRERRRIVAAADGGDRPDHAHRVGADALQRPAVRQSVRIRAALPIGGRPIGDVTAILQSALSLVQFPRLFSGAGALERSLPLRA